MHVEAKQKKLKNHKSCNNKAKQIKTMEAVKPSVAECYLHLVIHQHQC